MSLIKTYKDVPRTKVSPLAEDYSDMVLGKLTILYPAGRKDDHLMWVAECACGTKILIRAHQIANGFGKIDSCGRCQPLPRYNFQELTYTLEDTAGKPEQIELPLNEQDLADTGFGGNTIPEGGYDAPEPQCKDATTPTAWDVARRCCDELQKLGDKSRMKALQLVRVELGYEL